MLINFFLPNVLINKKNYFISRESNGIFLKTNINKLTYRQFSTTFPYLNFEKSNSSPLNIKIEENDEKERNKASSKRPKTGYRIFFFIGIACLSSWLIGNILFENTDTERRVSLFFGNH